MRYLTQRREDAKRNLKPRISQIAQRGLKDATKRIDLLMNIILLSEIPSDSEGAFFAFWTSGGKEGHSDIIPPAVGKR